MQFQCSFLNPFIYLDLPNWPLAAKLLRHGLAGAGRQLHGFVGLRLQKPNCDCLMKHVKHVKHTPTISIYIHLYPSISIYIHLYPSISIYIHLYPSISIYIHLYPSISIYIHLYPSISIYIHLYPSISIYIHLYPSISIYIHLYPSISIYIHLYPSISIYIHLYPSISIYIHLYPLMSETCRVSPCPLYPLYVMTRWPHHDPKKLLAFPRAKGWDSSGDLPEPWSLVRPDIASLISNDHLHPSKIGNRKVVFLRKVQNSNTVLL